ncbi:MAG: hypothetical protein JWP97_6551 [Labilithrix sp.]|nr:hypothetical protein [Labilithrix sp.]
MEDPDPIDELTHDHGHLGALAHRVTASVQRLAHGGGAEAADELVHAAESLRDALLAHFAREEEGLFPFVEEHVLPLRAEVAELLAQHDAVVQKATALVGAAGEAERTGAAGCVAALDAFVEVYASHARAEEALLHACDEALDPSRREALRTLLAAL